MIRRRSEFHAFRLDRNGKFVIFTFLSLFEFLELCEVPLVFLWLALCWCEILPFFRNLCLLELLFSILCRSTDAVFVIIELWMCLFEVSLALELLKVLLLCLLEFFFTFLLRS